MFESSTPHAYARGTGPMIGMTPVLIPSPIIDHSCMNCQRTALNYSPLLAFMFGSSGPSGEGHRIRAPCPVNEMTAPGIPCKGIPLKVYILQGGIMDTGNEIEEVRNEIRTLREDQQTLMNSLTSFADTVKTALTGALDRGTRLELQVAEITKILANFQARLDALEKGKPV